MANKSKSQNNPQTKTLVSAIIQGMQNKKAYDITVLDLQNIPNAVANYFILCSGQATTQVGAIAEGVLEKSYQEVGQRPWHQEGVTNKEWILLDYADVVVHIFQAEKRVFYDLENFWGDAGISRIVT
jgi:ribosome-associated protein